MSIGVGYCPGFPVNNRLKLAIEKHVWRVASDWRLWAGFSGGTRAEIGVRRVFDKLFTTGKMAANSDGHWGRVAAGFRREEARQAGPANGRNPVWTGVGSW